MEINDILTSIPSIIGTLYDSIYLINKELDKSYLIEYTGDELKVSPENNYEFYTKNLNVFKDNVLGEIEEKVNIRKVYKTLDDEDKLINVVTIDTYKLVLISGLLSNNEINEEKPSILIADDSPVITKFFTKIMSDEYNVIIATNGDEAIKLIEDNLDKKLLAAFIDLQMPVKNGYEVLEYFKEKNLFNELPVSVISGEDSQDGITRATAYGIVDMLQKPFSAEAAKSIVHKTISFNPNNK